VTITTIARPAEPEPAIGGSARGRGLIGWAATAAVGTALLLIAGAGLLRRSWMPPALIMPVHGPPWEVTALVSPRAIVVIIWIAGLLASAGIAAGLVAVRRGEPVPLRSLLVIAMVGVAVLIVLPPFGSTDALDYAIYGHIAALGHSPYVMTPAQYRRLLDLHAGVPRDWAHDPSVYGPLATAEQFAAARLGGISLARTVFWLKLWNALAFGAIAFAADRVLRADRAARVRAHLLWTANPLIIWSAVAAGHLDVLAAAIGLAGLLLADRPAARPLLADRPAARRPFAAALAAGLLVGAAADIKAAFALYGLGMAWAMRRRPGQLLAAAAGAAVILVPSYAGAGMAAIRALSDRAAGGLGYGFYGLFFRHLGLSLGDVVPVAACLLVPLAWLALRRIPAGRADQQAVRAALALSLAWLLVWPHQFAWYSVMIICVLAFFPASRLDWLALVWLAVMTITDMPGLGSAPGFRLGSVLTFIQSDNLTRIAPVVMLAALAAFLAGCCTRRWNVRPGG
jgi:hypothetical protein